MEPGRELWPVSHQGVKSCSSVIQEGSEGRDGKVRGGVG